MNRLLIILTIGVLTFSVSAQSAKEEFEKIYTRYTSAKSYSFDVTMTVKGGQGDYTSNLGHVLHGTDVHYTERGGNVSLITDDKSILLNKEHKTLRFISKSSKKKDEKTDVVSFFKGLKLSDYGSFIVKKEPSVSKIFYVPKDKSIYNKYVIKYNSSTHALIQIEYHITNPSLYDGATEIIISYKNEKLNSKNSSSRYSFDSYVQKKSGKIVLSEKYKDYHLILD